MEVTLANVVIAPLPKALTYLIPPGSLETISIGSMVTVPLGKQRRTGFVVSISQSQKESLEFEVKAVIETSHDPSCFNEEQLKFFEWISSYYGEPLSQIVDLAIPQVAAPKTKKTAVLIQEGTADVKGRVQKGILEMLARNLGRMDTNFIAKQIKGSSAALKELERKKIIEIIGKEEEFFPFRGETAPSWAQTEVSLGEHQSKALKDIIESCNNQKFETFLLHGVTGSGKTEVYIESIKEIVSNGGGAIVVVPEIALTPQLVDRFRARLGDDIAILHSALGRRKRWEAWKALLEGKARIAIGARSAIFAPVRDLRLIIVDEEHDSSYKQAEGIRYNARDLAIVRGKLVNSPVVLGSATPSLESYFKAKTGKYKYLRLPSRYAAHSSINIEIVDMSKVKPWEMLSRNISPTLYNAIDETIQRGEQAFILYNRRGFASYLQCARCEAVLECPNCSVTLTYHQSKNSLLCHYCGVVTPKPLLCPNCSKSESLEHRGAGTEKIFDELQSLFPNVRVGRLDRDTADDPSRLREILNDVREGKTAILVGTQMIAKGHDLPNVTLVGVADCDIGLHMPDFRASERVFQLLMQAGGRAGRGEKRGRAILQTRLPTHASLVHTQRADFENFAKSELKIRRELLYPPFAKILRLICSSQNKVLPERELNAIIKYVADISDFKEIRTLGPSPAPLTRIKTEWRWHVLFKAHKLSLLSKLTVFLKKTVSPSSGVKLVFDLDPQDML